MLSSQQMVVRSIEYAAAGAMLLLAAKIALIRLRQPADRINLILMTFVAASIVPLLVSFAPSPAWHLGMVGAAPPLQSAPRPALSETHALPAPRPQTESERNEIAQPPAPAAARGAARETDSRSLPPATKVPDRLAPWNLAAMGLLTIHGLATALLVVEWVVGVRWLRRMATRALPAGETVRGVWTSVTEGRGCSVRVLISSQVDTPLAYGCLRPTVVIPESIADGDLSALRFCLGHEWSHIERGDLRGWRLVWFCQFLLWFQPLFWILRRELRVCQDFLADRRAAGAGSDAIEYSQLLLEFSRRRMSRPVAGAIAFLDRSSQLSRRIKMLITSPLVLRSRSPLGFCLMAGTMSLVCAALFGAIRLDSVRGGDDAQPASSENTKPAQSKEQPAAKAETLHYTCVVLDKETGKGIPEASVVVRRSKLTSQENTIIEETRHTTDAEGKFSFEIPPAQVAESSLYIELDVEHDDYAARKGFGYALSMIRKNEMLGERPFFEKTELRPSEPTTGTVVDPDGKALAGVKVQGFSMSNAADFRDYHSFTDTVTDEAGKFRLNLVKGGTGVLWVLPTEYASTSREVNKQRGDLGEIRLRPGVRLSGSVLSAEGKPVPEIPVNIQYEGGGNETVNNLPVATSIRRSAITDGDGRFAFDPLPSGDYRVIPEEHRHDPIVRDRTRHEIAEVFLPVKVKIQEGVAAAPIEIQASPHVLIKAQILDSKGNKTRGHAFHVFGRMDGQHWFGEGARIPKGRFPCEFRMDCKMFNSIS
jgi:beta-lactamase regulating signal transducer with metallopeptidase domain/5-hydroxyisourate hydrolase-like protein (transthyretin family)